MAKKKVIRILIIGLPGSRQDYFSKRIKKRIKAEWLNADKIRKKFKDWDFSKEVF